jgi:hypothetical protein
MDGLVRDHVVTPTVTSGNNSGAVFSARGRCRSFITGNIRGLNLAAVKHTTVQVSRLPI